MHQEQRTKEIVKAERKIVVMEEKTSKEEIYGPLAGPAMQLVTLVVVLGLLAIAIHANTIQPKSVTSQTPTEIAQQQVEEFFKEWNPNIDEEKTAHDVAVFSISGVLMLDGDNFIKVLNKTSHNAPAELFRNIYYWEQAVYFVFDDGKTVISSKRAERLLLYKYRQQAMI